MKATIDGVEVECTVEEFLQLRGQPKPVERVVVNRVEPKPTRRVFTGRGALWTAEEDAMVRHLYTTQMRGQKVGWGLAAKLARKLKRGSRAVTDRANYLGLTTGVGKATANNLPTVRARNERQYMLRKSQNEVVKRELEKQTGITPEHAANIAFKKFDVPEMPKMMTIGDDLMGVFESIVKNIVANKGKLSLPTDAYSLGITRGPDWRAFVEEFIRKRAAIAKYFGVEEKFHLIIKSGKYHEIHYG